MQEGTAAARGKKDGDIIIQYLLAQGTDSTLRHHQRASGVPKNLQTESPLFKFMHAAYSALRRVRNAMMMMELTIVVTAATGCEPLAALCRTL